MTPAAISPRIFITDALLGWDVLVRPEALSIELGYDDRLDDLEFARCYARGLSLSLNCPVIDLSTCRPTIVPFERRESQA